LSGMLLDKHDQKHRTRQPITMKQEEFKTTYEKQLRQTGSELDDLQKYLQSQIDVMQALIIQLEKENASQRDIIEKLNKRLVYIESMEHHL